MTNSFNQEEQAHMVICDWLIILSCVSHSNTRPTIEPQSRMNTSKQIQHTDAGHTQFFLGSPHSSQLTD